MNDGFPWGDLFFVARVIEALWVALLFVGFLVSLRPRAPRILHAP